MIKRQTWGQFAFLVSAIIAEIRNSAFLLNLAILITRDIFIPTLTRVQKS